MIDKMEVVNSAKLTDFNIGKDGSKVNDRRLFEGNVKEKDYRLAGSKEELDEDKIRNLVEDSNHRLADNRLEFQLHEKSNRFMVKLIDKKTDKVIKEIPSEEFLDLVGRIEEFMGVFVDERV